MKITAKISILLAILTTIFMISSIQEDINKSQFYGQLTCVFSIITMFVAFASWDISCKQEKIEDMVEIVDDEQQDDIKAESGSSVIHEKEDEILLENQSENEANICDSSDDRKAEINDEIPFEIDKTASDDTNLNDGLIIVDEEDDEI